MFLCEQQQHMSKTLVVICETSAQIITISFETNEDYIKKLFAVLIKKLTSHISLKNLIAIISTSFATKEQIKVIKLELTCFFKMMCLPFQYFIIPKACNVLTMSYELMAISCLKKEKKHELLFE